MVGGGGGVSFWGRGGEGPDAGKKSGENAALDRPAPCKGKRTASVRQQGQRQGAAGGTASVRQQVGARQRGDSQKGTTALTGADHSLDWGWPQPSRGDTTALVDLRFSVPWGDGR